MSIILGEPIFRVKFQELISESGQTRLCRKIKNRLQNKNEIFKRIKEEWMAIARALYGMNVPFGVLFAHEKLFDHDAFDLTKSLEAKFVRLNNCKLPETLSMFPRDLCMLFDDLLLFHPSFDAEETRHNGQLITSSPYGEGGRTLYSGKTILVCEGIVGRDYSQTKKIQFLTKLGYKVETLPFPLANTYTETGGHYAYHLDKVACFIKGKDGADHLILDPKYESFRAADHSEDNVSNIRITGRVETLSYIFDVCEPLGIKLHVPTRLSVPASLCLHQFSDGRILMTSGDDEIAELVSAIVGEDKVTLTEIPIEWYPTMLRAGIRCLIGELPLKED